MRNAQFFGASLLGLGLVLATGCDSSSEELAVRSCDGDDCINSEQDYEIDWNDGSDALPALLPLDAVCGPQETNLIAGQHTDTGSIHVDNDGDSINIDVTTTNPYQLDEIHIYVGTGPVPSNKGGGVAPGQFPYNQEFAQPVGGHHLEVPLADLQVGCGDDLIIAVHAVVVADNGNKNAYQFKETAWGFGPSQFKAGWGWSFGHEVCCDAGGGDPDDGDGDGVDADHDCDDDDPRIGALLYENQFDVDDGYLHLGSKLLDPWMFDGEAHTTDGGQQALLGQVESWGDTVTFGSVRLSGIERECGNNCVEDNTRFRAGFLARTSADDDQDEGFHGYRCAVAQNSGADCYDPGPFVQLAAFLDAAEDDIASECVNGCAPNPTFDQLDREERSDATNFPAGDSGELVFWAVGQQLVCEFYGNDDEHVVARAVDERFDAGTTGLSTLNALADFEYVRVCEAFATP